MRTQNSELRSQNFVAALCFCGVFLIAGCGEQKKTDQSQALSQKEVKDANSPRKLAAEIKQLKRQLEGLMGIDKQARIDAISTITSIDITRRSNLYDKNDNKKKETLVVYLRPIDDMGDCIKAAGAVEVQLWNLSADPDGALLKSWEIEPEELKKTWSGSLLTSYYKLQFDVGDILTGKEKDLTLKVQFTDYLTGKILKEQRVINSK